MIQRIQSIFLLIVGITSLMIVNVDKPFYIETEESKNTKVMVDYNSTEATGEGEAGFSGQNAGLVYLLYATGILALLCIFLYKNRKLQSRMVFAVIVFTCLIFVDMYWFSYRMNYFETPSKASLTAMAAVPISMLIFSVLALRGILADEKLVRSLDRIR